MTAKHGRGSWQARQVDREANAIAREEIVAQRRSKKNKRATILTSSLSIVDGKEIPSLNICRAPSCSSRGMQDATLPFLPHLWVGLWALWYIVDTALLQRSSCFLQHSTIGFRRDRPDVSLALHGEFRRD